MLFSNGNYVFIGFRLGKRIYGVCVRTNNHSVFAVGEFRSVPYYHLLSDTKPQFRKISFRELI